MVRSWQHSMGGFIYCHCDKYWGGGGGGGGGGTHGLPDEPAPVDIRNRDLNIN